MDLDRLFLLSPIRKAWKMVGKLTKGTRVQNEGEITLSCLAFLMRRSRSSQLDAYGFEFFVFNDFATSDAN